MSDDIESLRDHFAGIFDEADKDPLEHIVILSYEFDDQQVLNLVVQRPLSEQFEPRVLHLAQVAEIVPVVIYDARKTREHNRLPHFMELLAVRKPVWTCHHSKAYLIVTRKRIHLALGSMNLTASGLFSNREVFETFSWADDETKDRQVLEDFVRVVREGYASFESAPLVKALGVVERRLENWQSEPGEGGVSASLIHQGYEDGTGLALLARNWKHHFGDATPERAIAVSPFFDRAISEGVFAGELLETFPGLKQLDIVTDESVGKSLCQRHFGEIANKRLFLIPQDMQPAERERIAHANEGIDIRDLAIARKLHAKILVLSRGDTSLVYIGSANFTRKAWGGANHEMGVARLHHGRVDSLLRTILKSLSAESADRYADLPVSLPPEDVAPDDEDYKDLTGYPEFVQGIELVESSQPDMMEFVVKAESDRINDLKEYVIRWGSSELQFTGRRSQAIGQDRLISCLLGGRNLKFTSRSDPAIAYYLPFRHAPALFAQRELYVFPSAEDWMFHYLGVESHAWRDPYEYLPGDTPIPEDDPVVPMHAARNANPVIRMQQYLSLFSRIQSEFRARMKALDDAPAGERDHVWESQVAGPLSTFASVLERRNGHYTIDHEVMFKLGELMLFVRTLAQAKPEAKPLLARLLDKLPANSDDIVVNEYLRFCHREE